MGPSNAINLDDRRYISI